METRRLDDFLCRVGVRIRWTNRAQLQDKIYFKLIQLPSLTSLPSAVLGINQSPILSFSVRTFFLRELDNADSTGR